MLQTKAPSSPSMAVAPTIEAEPLLQRAAIDDLGATVRPMQSGIGIAASGLHGALP